MAIRLKTVAFPLPNLASIPNNTLTNFKQITVDLPESSKTFRKVWVDFMSNDTVTATGGTLTTKSMGCRLGAASYTTVSNIHTLTHTGENIALFLSQDFTSHFTTNWSGTSMTFDLQVQINQSTGTNPGMASGSAILWVTYEYDDASTTQVLNAWIPMNSALGALPSAKGTAQDTIPNLDSFLGYGSISYKHIMMIMEGNESVAGDSTDFAITVQLDSTTAQVGSSHTSSLASDRYVREHFDLMVEGTPIFTTNATHDFFAWVSTGGVTRMNHAAFTMLVVFTFDASSANAGNISLLLPMELDSPMGGTASTDAQKGTIELWIEEAATVTIQNSAYRLYWDQISAVDGLNARCGTQSYASYTDTASVTCGSNVLQKTCHDNITLARGRNILSFDVYRTDTTDKGWNISGFWIINYKCGKPSGGWGVANRTVIWNILQIGTAAPTAEYTIAATALIIPETNYFISAIGLELCHFNGAQTYGFNAMVERLAAEGGVAWERVYIDHTHSEPEIGLRKMYAQMRSLFKRFPTDADPTRVDLETNRRWRIISPRNVNAWYTANIMLTYHAITFTVSGTITGSGGGTVNLFLHKGNSVSASNKGELMQTGYRSGNGSYSFTVYDNTEDVYVEGVEDETHVGRSADSTAT